MTLDIVNPDQLELDDVRLLKAVVETIGQGVQDGAIHTPYGTEVAPGLINMQIVDDDAMRALNKEAADNDYVTDVLSFSYLETEHEDDPTPPVVPEEGLELGDLVICLPQATKQAGEYSIPVIDELALLTAHACLHIIGFDHQDKAGQQTMARLQHNVLKKVGIVARKLDWKHA